jgi:lipase maturation factor 1
MRAETRAPSSRVFVTGVYLRSLWLTLSFVLGCLGYQIVPLLGNDGILPASALLKQVESTVPGPMSNRFFLFPTACWFIGTSDLALHFLSYGGAVLALVAAIVGGGAGKTLSSAAALMLVSIIVVGGDFCQFPWDFLLIEAMFIALFYPSAKPFWESWGARREPSHAALLATHFLLFRFMWAMGLEKLPIVNGEKAWADMTFLQRFYETEQPLPTALSWVLTKMPMGFHKVSTLGTWFIELIVPLWIFGSARWQFWSAVLQAILMLAIQLAGNYATFQVVTVVLMIPLLTDSVFLTAGPADGGEGTDATGNTEGETAKGRQRMADTLQRYSVAEHTGNAVLLSHALMGACFLLRILEPGGLAYLGNANWMYDANAETKMPAALVTTLRALHPWRIVNQYGGIFHDTFTHEGHVALVFRSSMDGLEWNEHHLKFSIQNETSFPLFFAPWMPRLDHAAFYEGTRVQFHSIQPSNPFYNAANAWFLKFSNLILIGSPHASFFFREDPFLKYDGRPPKYVSAVVRSYKFDSYEALREKGHWSRKLWTGTHLGAVQNCNGLSPRQYRTCIRSNCKALMSYYKVDYYKEVHTSCEVSDLSSDSLDSVWSTKAMASELAITLLPDSYRQTIFRWVRDTMLAPDAKSRSFESQFPIAVAEFGDDEIVLKEAYNVHKARYGWKTVVHHGLWSCLYKVLYIFRVGDVNEDKLLDMKEAENIFELLDSARPAQAAMDLMAYAAPDTKTEAGTPRRELALKDLLSSEELLQEYCEEL